MERETGIEPATNSLEGCDSTTELLPHSHCHSGGEGRIRTFEAAGATDLQSVAFDRFATSPKLPADVPGANVACRVVRSSVRIDAPRDAVRLVSFVGGVAGIVELAKGFEPPTG